MRHFTDPQQTPLANLRAGCYGKRVFFERDIRICVAHGANASYFHNRRGLRRGAPGTKENQPAWPKSVGQPQGGCDVLSGHTIAALLASAAGFTAPNGGRVLTHPAGRLQGRCPWRRERRNA